MTREDPMDEIVRLTRGLDHWRDWSIEEHRRPYGEVVSPGDMLFLLTEDGPEELEAIHTTHPERDTGRHWLSRIDPKTVRPSDARTVLKMLREWYSHVASDIRAFQDQAQPAETQIYSDYLGRFRTDVGFDLMSEGNAIRGLALKALENGAIKTRRDWDTLNELRVDISQTILSTDEMARVSDLMDGYEARQ
ncbi:hypothetical protein [Roseovarius sp.]|uniref:hypothetical protein n=1 Tax=Roseovarius sp. TaxID=1486281 RepID=UPI003BAD8D2E